MENAPRASRIAWIASVFSFIALFALLLTNATTLDRTPTISALELRVLDLPRSVDFFSNTLGFERAASGAPNAEQVRLQLGTEMLILDQQSSPAKELDDGAANDPSFQHIAIVVSDMDRAVERLRQASVRFVSTGPQRLPDWNRDAAGIRALYFRDPDGHFLELIQFPPFKGEPRWQRKDRGLFMGIDHTAIVVDDLSRALAFFRDTLGMIDAGTGENYGLEQEALSGVRGARVRIASLRGTAGAGVELLQYIEPRPVGTRPAANDWTIRFRSAASRSALADPDGHAIAFDTDAGNNLPSASATFRAHWPRYAMEGGELGVFMTVTIWLTLLLEHPRSLIHRQLASPTVRRVLMGLGIGTTVIFLINSRFGIASGAHFNPSVTLAMLSLHRIDAWDACFYVAAQFIGGAIGVALASLPFWRATRHDKVKFAATLPGEGAIGVALIGEFIISFVLFSSLLMVQDHVTLKPYIAYFAGVLLFLYITFEAPFSGMSMNPARTVASAIFARRLESIWLYFVAPVPAMVLAAQLFGH